jgi:hypothetical protein
MRPEAPMKESSVLEGLLKRDHTILMVGMASVIVLAWVEGHHAELILSSQVNLLKMPILNGSTEITEKIF